MDADYHSRRKDVNKEWSLPAVVYHNIVEILGSPSINLFASRTNKKMKPYVSRRPGSGCLVVDTFSMTWVDLFPYCFPPFSRRTLDTTRQSTFDSSTLAYVELVSASSDNAHLLPDSISCRQQTPVLPHRPSGFHPLYPGPVGCNEVFRNILKGQRLSEQSKDIISASWRPNTWTRYQSVFTK